MLSSLILDVLTCDMSIALLFVQTRPCVQNFVHWYCTVRQGYLDIHCRVLTGVCSDMSQGADILGVSSKDETLPASLNGGFFGRVW